MKIVWVKPVSEQIYHAYLEAAKTQRAIEKIVLTMAEGRQLKQEWDRTCLWPAPSPDLPPGSHMYGIPLEVEK